jgi:hypothetical protein
MDRRTGVGELEFAQGLAEGLELVGVHREQA